MENKFTSAYTYFEDLAKSPDFLGFLLNNISYGVFLLNKNLELQSFNEPFRNMFSNKRNEHLQYVRCGEAIGCAYQVVEQVNCGDTSHCTVCTLRIDALEAYAKKKPIFNRTIVREFFKTDGSKENKTLTYTIKPIYFNDDYYLLVLAQTNKAWSMKNYESISVPSETFYS